MSRSFLEIGLALLLTLLVVLLSPGPAITGPLASLVLLGAVVQTRVRRRGHHR